MGDELGFYRKFSHRDCLIDISVTQKSLNRLTTTLIFRYIAKRFFLATDCLATVATLTAGANGFYRDVYPRPPPIFFQLYTPAADGNNAALLIFLYMQEKEAAFETEYIYEITFPNQLLKGEEY